MAGIAHNNQNLGSSALLKTFDSALVLPNAFQPSALKVVLAWHLLYQYRKPSEFFRLAAATNAGIKVGSCSGPFNKLLNLAHCVRWTAAPLQMCGFATQNSTTHFQSHIRWLRGRYAKNPPRQ